MEIFEYLIKLFRESEFGGVSERHLMTALRHNRLDFVEYIWNNYRDQLILRGQDIIDNVFECVDVQSLEWIRENLPN